MQPFQHQRTASNFHPPPTFANHQNYSVIHHDIQLIHQSKEDQLIQTIQTKQSQKTTLVDQIEVDKRITSELIQDVNETKLKITKLEQKHKQLSAAAQKAAADVIGLDLLTDIASHAQCETALAEAELEHGRLKQQLNNVSLELNRLETELGERTQRRNTEHEEYIHSRQNAERDQNKEMATVAFDMEEYGRLLRIEEEATLQLLKDTKNAKDLENEQGQTKTNTLDVEESVVLSDQHELLEAWATQEAALVDSLAEIEQDASILSQQSSELRNRFLNDNDNEDNNNNVAELEAELFHVMELMRTKHTQLGLLKRRLAIMNEERSTINVLVSQWREANHSSKRNRNEKKDSLIYQTKSISNHLNLVRNMMGVEGNIQQREHGEYKEQRSSRPEVEMLNHLSKMRKLTKWTQLEEQRSKQLHQVAKGDVAKGDDLEEMKSSNHKMWLNQFWIFKDHKENECEVQYRHFVRRVKYQVDELLNVQQNGSKAFKSSTVKLNALRIQHTNVNQKNQKLIPKEDYDLAKNAHVKSFNVIKINKLISSTKILLNEKVDTLAKQQKNASDRIQTSQKYDSDMNDLENELKVLRIRHENEIKEIQQEEKNCIAEDVAEDVAEDKDVGPLTTKMLLTPAPEKKRRKKKQNDPFDGDLEQKLQFLTFGGILERRSASNGNKEQRNVSVSKDFERLEVMFTKSTSGESALKRETFYKTISMSSVQKIKSKSEKAFSIYFKNNSSKSITFYCPNTLILQKWISSLNMLMYHAKDKGGIARMRHRVNIKK